MRGLACFRVEESLACRPRTPDPYVVRPLGKHRGTRPRYLSTRNRSVVELEYGHDAPSLISQLSSACAENRVTLDGAIARTFWRIERSLDIQFKLLGQVLWMFGGSFAPKSESERIALGLYHKTFLGNFAAYQLLTQGLFGPARPLLRHSFESYVLAKFFIVAEDERLALKWRNAEMYVLGRDVLRKIGAPDVEPLRKFWGVLSDHTHASIVSLQGTVDVTEPDHHWTLRETLVHFEMILQCGFHVLNSHLITRSMVWYASHYREESHIAELRRVIREIFTEARPIFNERARFLVHTFRRKWTIDEAPSHPKLRYSKR